MPCSFPSVFYPQTYRRHSAELTLLLPSYVDHPEQWKVHGWSYTDARDLGNMCHAALTTDNLGFQVFNAVNDDITNDEPSEEFLGRMCPGTRFKRGMGTFEAPVTNRKMKEMLGFEEEGGWRGRWEG